MYYCEVAGPEFWVSELFLYSVPETVHEMGPPRPWPGWNLVVHVWCTERLCIHQEFHLAHVPEVWVCLPPECVCCITAARSLQACFPVLRWLGAQNLWVRTTCCFSSAPPASWVWVLPDWCVSAQRTVNVLDIKAKLMGIQVKNQWLFTVALRSNTVTSVATRARSKCLG